MEYIALVQGTDGARKLIPIDEDVFVTIDQAKDKDWYSSIFIYNDEHKKRLATTGSLAGIRDVTTNKLVWDFDSKDNLAQAQQDAAELCNRLISRHGIDRSFMLIAFSGQKGFSVTLPTNKRFTPEEFKSTNIALAEGLQTNDTSICDANRIFRIAGTKHQRSGLYKFPLTYGQLQELEPKIILELAKDISETTAGDEVTCPVELPDSIYNLRSPKAKEKIVPIVISNDIDFKIKPKGISNCKYAIMHGFFPAGSRNNSMTALAATFKALGFPKEAAYSLCKTACAYQSERTGTERFSKEELWNGVIESVYKSTWNGGQYTCKKEPWLKAICDSLGSNKCRHEKEQPGGFVEMADISAQFQDYSFNIEKNTIRTGVVAIDENIRLTVGMPVALLGAPSSGKTSLSLSILNNTSKAGIASAFFSMDMYGPLIYMKQIQKHFSIQSDRVHEIYRHEKAKRAEIDARVKEEYKNVKFSLKAGHTVQEMRDLVNDQEQKTGEKVKLVMIDYLECIAGPYSDATANTHRIAGELRDFATETDRCVITLVQPPKSAGDASSELTSMRQIKGSSMLEQSFRAVLGIYRDGFGPKYADWDKFITINCLKNTMGNQFQTDNYWNGLTGEIRPLTEEEEEELSVLRKRRKEDSAKTNPF